MEQHVMSLTTEAVDTERAYLEAHRIQPAVQEDGATVITAPAGNEIVRTVKFSGELVVRDDLLLGATGEDATIVLAARLKSLHVRDSYFGSDVTVVEYDLVVTSVDIVEGQDVVTTGETTTEAQAAAMRRQTDRRMAEKSSPLSRIPRPRKPLSWIVRKG